MKLLFVTDAIHTFNYKKDTTLAMMWAGKAQGCALYNCQVGDLFLQKSTTDGTAFGRISALEVSKNPNDFFTLAPKQTMPLSEFDAIIMRKDPPFDMRYIYATYMLEAAERAGVLVVNKPQSLRDCNEKLFAMQFAEFIPPTLVSSLYSELKEFIGTYEDVVVKPLDGMGGQGIFRLQKSSVNIGATLEVLTQNQHLPIMAQRYIPEITQGDKRVLIVHGKPMSHCLARIPAKGELRGNLAAGGTGVVQPLSEHDKQVASSIAPQLLEKGLYFVGLDMIGGYITEINVTSPTCIQEIDAGAGTNIAQEFISGILNRCASTTKMF